MFDKLGEKLGAGVAKAKIQELKQRVLKIDDNHNGKPDLLEKIDKAESVVQAFERVAGHVDQERFINALLLANSLLGLGLPDSDLRELGAGLHELPQLLHSIDQGLQFIETEVQK